MAPINSYAKKQISTLVESKHLDLSTKIIMIDYVVYMYTGWAKLSDTTLHFCL